MSGAEKPTNETLHDELNAYGLLQIAQDELGIRRALKVGGSLISIYGLRRHDLIDRNPDDLTLIGNNYLEAQPSRTPKERTKFAGKIANLGTHTDVFDEHLDKHGLNQPDSRFLIAVDHHMLADIDIGLKILNATEFGSQLPVENVTAWISKMLPYTDIRMPFPWSKKLGSLEKMVSPFANSALVIPDSPTTDKLRADHKIPINKINGDLIRIVRSKQRKVEGPVVEVVASPQSQYKKYRDGLMFNLATAGSIKLFASFIKRGIPIVFMGVHTDPVRYQIPYSGRQNLRLSFAEPIINSAGLTDHNGDIDRKLLAIEVNRRHYQTASSVSEKQIYLPENYSISGNLSGRDS